MPEIVACTVQEDIAVIAPYVGPELEIQELPGPVSVHVGTPVGGSEPDTPVTVAV